MGCNSSKGLNDSTDSEGLKTPQPAKIEQRGSRRYESMRDDTGTSELLIAVVGYTGSGMSQFIHDLTGSYQHGVGRAESMSPTTRDIQTVEGRVDGRKITFIDTPGFDGVSRDESTVFQELSEWLSENYSSNAKLAGIVYMQNMTNDALYRAGYRFEADNADGYLKKSCGPNWHQKIVLVCSHWDVEGDQAEMKEKELKNGYWRSMIRKGSPMGRFGPPGDSEHAKLILSSIIP